MKKSEFLSENTDEIIAITTAVPIVGALIYLAGTGIVDPIAALLPPLMIILNFYYNNKKEGEK